MTVSVQGITPAGWGSVADVFARNFADAGDIGAAFAVYLDGALVLDVWAGTADVDTGRPWARDTVGNVFSCTKGWMATLANQLIQEGAIDPDAPVSRYWPEFGTAGKQDVTVRQILCHQAGLAAIEGEFTLDEALSWTPITTALAAQKPDWVPGTAHGYHLRSFGWLTGELVRRVTGDHPGQAWDRRVARPLGLSAWIGMPPSEHHRCARLIPPDTMGNPSTEPDPGSFADRVRSGPSNLFHYDQMWNTAQIRSAVIPSSGGISDARSLARVSAACVGPVDGIRLLDVEVAAVAARPLVDGTDLVLGRNTTFGRGYMVGSSLPPEAGRHSFGHAGAGGSLAFADPDASLGFGYLPNRMRLDPEDSRARDLATAVYAVLG